MKSIFFVCLLVVGSIIVFPRVCKYGHYRDGVAGKSKLRNDRQPNITSDASSTIGPRRVVRPTDSEGLDRKRLMSVFAYEWERTSSEVRGAETLARQRQLAIKAIGELGGCRELIQLLNFLATHGAGDLRQDLIDNHLGTIFTGPQAKEAQEWLLTVEDVKLREHLCRLAGESFEGVGFREYFEVTGAVAGRHCQAALLAGHCVALAKTDPEGAVRVYKEMGYPKRIDNTGLAQVMAAFPPTTDFLKFATEIKDDSMTLAKRSRAALLANWSGVKPAEAAQYVIANTTVIHPDQMGVVIGKWAETAPDAATEWLNQAPAGKPRDEGMAALAQHWTAGGDPVKAWQYAAQVGDEERRAAVATEVFKEWAKTDRAAAEKAWVELFPAK